MIKILIVEDEIPAQVNLKKLIDRCCPDGNDRLRKKHGSGIQDHQLADHRPLCSNASYVYSSGKDRSFNSNR